MPDLASLSLAKLRTPLSQAYADAIAQQMFDRSIALGRSYEDSLADAQAALEDAERQSSPPQLLQEEAFK